MWQNAEAPKEKPLKTGRTTLAPHQSALLAAAVVAALSYFVPPIHWLFLPLQYLNTHFHEMCHALAATATGGQVLDIQVFSNASGVTEYTGGIHWLTTSAGYTGATLIGSAAIYFGRTPGHARGTLAVMAGLLSVSELLWVRGDAVGLSLGWFWVAGLFASVWFLKGQAAVFACQLFGLEQCLNALGSVYELLKISVFTETRSDAVIMQDVTYIPAAVWASLWCLFSILMVALTVRKAWSQGAGLSPNPGSPGVSPAGPP